MAASPEVEAGQIVVSGRCAYRVLGPPENHPMRMWHDDEDEGDHGEMVDRLSLPVEPVTPQIDPPSGGHWIDESCFASLPRYALIATSIELDGATPEQKSEAQR